MDTPPPGPHNNPAHQIHVMGEKLYHQPCKIHVRGVNFTPDGTNFGCECPQIISPFFTYVFYNF